MDNAEWGQRLREEYKRKTGYQRRIRLPVSDQISFEGGVDALTVTLQTKSICSNLQTNRAAFEAWSLALRVWCGIENIELRWQPLSNRSDEGWYHYQRFLYRAERFRSLFPEWFHLNQPVNDSEALGDGDLYLNVPGRRAGTETEAEAATNHDPRTTIREAKLEKDLLKSKTFKEHFGLEKVDRQFPVGLFRESVANGNRIFPGAKSAIDLIGLGEEKLSLFELKAGHNIPAGILSELIFYTSVIRDALGPNARFKFSGENRMAISVRDIRNCKRVEAVLLGEQFHPLVGHPRVIGLLNEAVRRQWNASSEAVPITFKGTFLKGSETAGYEFRDIDS